MLLSFASLSGCVFECADLTSSSSMQVLLHHDHNIGHVCVQNIQLLVLSLSKTIGWGVYKKGFPLTLLL